MRQILLGKLDYKGEKKMIMPDQDVHDIMKSILENHEKFKKDYDKISYLFIRSNEKQTLKAIFDYLKKNVDYKVESSESQFIKSPGSIIATGKTTGSDCKSYALFINGIIDSINRSGKMRIPFCYRFSSYRIMEDQPQHVFSVVNPGTKNEIWIDPVLPTFNNRKQYYSKIDKKPKMALYTLSGIGCSNCDSCNEQYIGGRKEKRAAKRQSRKSGENCTGRKIPKYAPPLIAGRRAFILLLDINLFQNGRKMVILMRNPATRMKVLQKWCSMGGNAQKFIKAIKKIEKRLISKNKITAGIRMPLIGCDPTCIAAAITTASPYIAAFTPILALASRLVPPGSRSANIIDAASSAGESLSNYAANQPG